VVVIITVCFSETQRRVVSQEKDLLSNDADCFAIILILDVFCECSYGNIKLVF